MRPEVPLTVRTISPFQFALLVTTAFLGLGLFQFPRGIVQVAGNETLYAFALSGFGAIAGVWLIFRVAHVAPNQTVFAWAQRALPWPVYGLFLALADGLHLGLPMVAMGEFAALVRTFFLPDTPPWAVSSLMVGMALWMLWWDLPQLVRTVQIVFLPVVAATIAFSGLLIPHFQDGWALQWVPITRPGALVQGALIGFQSFLGYEVIALLWPYVPPTERPRAERWAYLALLGAFSLYTLQLVLTFGTEDPYFLLTLDWPALSALRLISVPGIVINKLGLLVVVLWGLLTMFFVSIRCWAICHATLPALARQGGRTYRLIASAVMTAIWLGSLALTTPERAEAFARTIDAALVGFVILYPPLFWWAGRRWRARQRGEAPASSPHPARDGSGTTSSTRVP